MKHLLIILSFLLLYSPVIGDNHKVETLYLWETSSGTVWKGYGDKEFQDYYVGEWKNGKPNGLGVMIYTNYKSKYQFIVKRKGKYIGEWKEGKWNGQGIHKNKFQDTFVGEFRNDIYWEGTLYSIEGKIEGKFENGQGTLENSSQRYVGEYKNGIRWNGKLYHLWKGNVYDEDGTLIYKYVNGKEIKQ